MYAKYLTMRDIDVHVHILHPHTCAQVCRSSSLFRCRVMDGLPGNCVLPTTAEHPFYSASVDKSVLIIHANSAHVDVYIYSPDIKPQED